MRDLKAKSGQDSGLKACLRGGMPKITLGITGLHEILGWDLGIEEPYWEPSWRFFGTENIGIKSIDKHYYYCYYFALSLIGSLIRGCKIFFVFCFNTRCLLTWITRPAFNTNTLWSPPVAVLTPNSTAHLFDVHCTTKTYTFFIRPLMESVNTSRQIYVYLYWLRYSS